MTPAYHRRDHEILELDRAVSLVRILLSGVGAVVVGTHGAVVFGVQSYLASICAALLVLGSVMGWRFVPVLRQRLRDPSLITADAVLQLLDTMAFVVLVVLLGPAVEEVAWIALVVPIVIAGLRFGPHGILVTWAIAAGSYLALLAMGFGAPSSDAIKSSVIVERPGALLAIAVAVAVLAGWSQEGWVEQAELRASADRRLDRVRVIEGAGRAMRDRAPEAVLATCLDSMTQMGFVAATRTVGSAIAAAVGDGAVLPAGDVPARPEKGHVEVMRWISDDGGMVYSASALEESSGTTLSGWSGAAIGPDLARSLGDLVGHATIAHRAASLLESLSAEATLDPLTGLANRRELDRHLAAVSAEPGPIAVLMIDLDDFKSINDTHGHRVGDEVLVAIARRLSEVTGNDGLVARYGGDEFIVVLSGQQAAAASALARDLLHSMREPIRASSTWLVAGLSVGVAIGQGPVRPEVLHALADRAVYEAKEAGRGTSRTIMAGGHLEAAGPRDV